MGLQRCLAGDERESLFAPMTPTQTPTSVADRPPDLSLVHQLTPANLVTTASLVTGLVALLEATRAGTGMSHTPAPLLFGLIALAAFLDAIDGPLARLTHSTSVFGGTLDSLADVVSFGLVPAVVAYFAVLYRIPVLGAVVCTAYCTCAAWRLARFQVCGHGDWFVGCPVPTAAVMLAFVVVIDSSAITDGITVALLSALMIGALPFPTWSVVRQLIGSSTVPEQPEQPAQTTVAHVAAFTPQP